MIRHQIVRQRHDTRRRTLTVETIEALTPHMMRMRLTSPDLHDFVSPAADDHIKLFFPETTGAVDGRPVMRDFTPRRFDTQAGWILIDFALHDAGPAVSWARQAQVGDSIKIGGPRGSKIVPDDFDWYLLIGDETALPAIGRRVEQLRAGVPVITAALVAGPDETQSFETVADLTSLWAIRNDTEEEAVTLRRTLEGLAWPAGDGFVWIAAEVGTARAIRAYIVDERGHPKEWLKAGGYWTRGEVDAHTNLDD